MNDTLKTMTAEIETATHAVDVAAGCIQNAYELLASTPKHHTRIMADRTAGYEYAQAHYHNMVEKANELRCKLKVLVESLGGKVWWHINGLVAKIEIPDMVTVNERHIVYNSTVMPGLNFGVANWNQTLQDLVNNMVALCDDILEARRDKEDAYVAVLEAYFESGEKAEKWCCCGPTKKEMAALIRRVAYYRPRRRLRQTAAGHRRPRVNRRIRFLVYNDKYKVMASADYDGPDTPDPEVVVHPTDWVVRQERRGVWIYLAYRDKDFKDKYEPYR